MASTEKVWVNNSAPTCEDNDLNGFKNENNNLIEGSAQSLNTGDLQQTHKAVAQYSADGNRLVDSGAVNAYVLGASASKQAPSSYTDGLTVNFSALNQSTGASTVNVNALGVKNIFFAGSAISAGEISGIVRITFSLSDDRFNLTTPGLTKTTVITSSSTHTTSDGAHSIDISCIGAGGGGGAVDGQGAGTAAAGGGGGGGGAAKISTSVVATSYTVVIGALGAAGAAGNNPGSAGGTSTVTGTGVSLSAIGGAGGTGALGGTAVLTFAGGAGGTATGGDLNLPGGVGFPGRRSGGNVTSMGHGGTSYLGGGVASTTAGGANAVQEGAGGSGGISEDGSANNAGGDGAPGMVIIKEYF